jgi:hypothetical protein
VFVDSYFHLCRRGYHHDNVDVDVVAVGTDDVDEDSVALYLGYYDWAHRISRMWVGLWIVHILYRHLIYDLCRM